MWGNVLGDAGHFGVFLDDAFDGTGGEAAIIAGGVDFIEIAAIIKKEGGEGIAAGVEIILDMLGGGGRNKNWAVFAAFAADDKFATVEVDRIAVEASEFGNAEATGEK